MLVPNYALKLNSKPLTKLLFKTSLEKPSEKTSEKPSEKTSEKSNDTYRNVLLKLPFIKLPCFGHFNLKF